MPLAPLSWTENNFINVLARRQRLWPSQYKASWPCNSFAAALRCLPFWAAGKIIYKNIQGLWTVQGTGSTKLELQKDKFHGIHLSPTSGPSVPAPVTLHQGQATAPHNPTQPLAHMQAHGHPQPIPNSKEVPGDPRRCRHSPQVPAWDVSSVHSATVRPTLALTGKLITAGVVLMSHRSLVLMLVLDEWLLGSSWHLQN